MLLEVFGLRNFGQHYHSSELVAMSEKFIASNFVECSFTEEFPSLDKEAVVTLLSRNDLQVKLEEDIFTAITIWINYHAVIRSQNIFELLKQVRLDVVKPYYLASVIATYQACKSSTDCQQLIKTAALYHLNHSKCNKTDVI